MSAEHGSFVKGPGEEDFINMTESLDMSWMSEVEEIFRYYMEVSKCDAAGFGGGWGSGR
jgi:trehalose 6-phosphate synthase/phosphatase